MRVVGIGRSFSDLTVAEFITLAAGVVEVFAAVGDDNAEVFALGLYDGSGHGPRLRLLTPNPRLDGGEPTASVHGEEQADKLYLLPIPPPAPSSARKVMRTPSNRADVP
jgi:hypothetical protein